MKEIVPIIVDNEFACNCYLLCEDNHVIIIDPGTKNNRIIEEIEKRNVKVDAILLTHAHFDHIAGIDKLSKLYHCPLYLHEADLPMLQDPYLNYSFVSKAIVVKTHARCYEIGHQKIGNFDLEIIDVPGHTNGSVIIRSDNVLFSGDTLFLMGIGRTDLPGGSNSKMMQSLKIIKTFNPEWIVYPGHGDFTTIHDELLYNPYLTQL